MRFLKNTEEVLKNNMEQTLELKPFVRKKGQKYIEIEITDVTLHTSKKTPTSSTGKKIQKAINSDKPGRVYYPADHLKTSPDQTITMELLKMDPDFVKMVQNEESKGYKVLIRLPKKGIPLLAGQDTVQFMNSKNGKRIARKLAEKEKQE